MRQFGLAITILAATGFGAFAADPDPKAVIERAVKAHGGLEALKKYPGGEYKVEGDAVIVGEKAKLASTISYALPDKFRMTVETTILEKKSLLVVVVNGDKVKAMTNSKTEDLKDNVKAEFRQLASVQEVSLLYPLLDADKYTLKAEKNERIDAKEVEVVLVTRKGMKDIKMYFEKETGRLVRFVHKMPSPLGGEVDHEVTQSEFKEFSGVLYPTVQKIKQQGKDYMTLKFTDVKLIDKPDLKAYAVD